MSGPVTSRVQSVCLVLLTAIASAGALYWLRPVMIPFILALFVWLALSSLLDFEIRRLRMPRPLAWIATALLGGLALSGLTALVSASVGQLAAQAPAYNAQLEQIAGRLTGALPEELLGVPIDDELAKLSDAPVRAVGRLLGATTNAALELLSQSFLVLIFAVFLMIGGAERAPPTGTWGEIETRVKSYIVIKVCVSALTGVLVGAVLGLLGVPLALVFGLFAFLLNFIPSIGSVIATLLPLPVVVVSPEISSGVAVLALALPGAIQLVVGNFLEPRLMGSSLDLHPVVILLSLIFWGTLWGIAGMLLATPITAVARILFEKIESTRPIAELMAGRLGTLRSPSPAAREAG